MGRIDKPLFGYFNPIPTLALPLKGREFCSNLELFMGMLFHSLIKPRLVQDWFQNGSAQCASWKGLSAHT